MHFGEILIEISFLSNKKYFKMSSEILTIVFRAQCGQIITKVYTLNLRVHVTSDSFLLNYLTNGLSLSAILCRRFNAKET